MERVPNLVSVVVTSYNRERYIEEALTSLTGQTYRSLEIIVVDDASTDKTLQQVGLLKERLTDTDPSWEERLIIVPLPRNVGYAGALTTGMFSARGEFIAIQDSDDKSHPSRIQKQVEFLRNHRGIELVGSLYEEFGNDTAPVKKDPAAWIRFGDRIPDIYKKGGHCICWGTTLFRSTVFDRTGGLSRRVGRAADYYFLRRCVLGGVRADNLQEILYYYRRHPSQMSLKKKSTRID